MTFKNVRPGNPPRGSSLWSRLASEILARLLGSAHPALAESPPVVGVRKTAVCKDAGGRLRTIELFLPADLVGQLSRPLDIKFLDGEHTVTADEVGKAIKSNFLRAGGGSL